MRTTPEDILAAVADTLFPQGGDLSLGAADMPMSERLKSILDRMPRGLARRFDTLLRVFNASVVLTSGHTFLRLTPEARLAYFGESDTSRNPIRKNLAMIFKLFCELLYMSDERVQRAVGYDGLSKKPRSRDFGDSPSLHCRMYPDIRDEEWECDVCVVGSGAGGAIVAKELAEAGFKVLILEEGGPATRTDFDRHDLLERVGRFYRSHGFTTTFGTPPILLPMGCAVGGTTVVNSGTCFRTPEPVLAEWAGERGIAGMDPEAMSPLFDRVERILNIQPVGDEIMSRNGEVLKRGAEALGISDHGPIRRPVRDCHGSGECAFGCPTDAKQAMHLSYLPLAVEKGAVIVARCRVSRVEFQANRAVGLEAELLDPQTKRPAGRIRVRARRIVLAAGAIYTPWLLHRSGYRHALLGRNLRIHPGCGIAALFDEEILGWKGVMQCYYVHDLHEKGILLEATFPPPIVSYSAGTLPFVGLKHKELVARYRNVSTLGVILSDRSEGRVSFTPFGPVMRYSMTSEDVLRMKQAIEWGAQIYFAAGAKRVFTILPGLDDVSRAEDVPKISTNRAKGSSLKLSAYHPMGTCRMGANDDEGVTDADGRVFGIDNLYVADASLLPGTPHVNPQVTIMALATKVAFGLREGVKS
ncbi:MAG: GMC family oxidoreductase [Nitrospirae bacterium]|nr:GMC family oxidoreductase [Nitrospirota bacterium]